MSGTVVDPLLDGLLLDTVPPLDGGSKDAVEAAVSAHREHRRAWYGDLLGPLRVPASAVEAFIYALAPGDEMRVVLGADRDDETDDEPASYRSGPDPLDRLRRARAQVLDNHRVELVGVELPLGDFLTLDRDGAPSPDAVAEATERALSWLDFSVPAWLTVEAVPLWRPAFDILAEDAAENIGLVLPRPAWTPEPAATAEVLRDLTDRELSFAVVGGVSGLVSTAEATGLLNLLVAVRRLMTGAPVGEVASVLTQTDLEPLADAVRELTEAEAATVRDFLPFAAATSVHDLVAALEAEGLIAPDAA